MQPINLIMRLSLICSFLLCSFLCIEALAADGATEAQWFANLVKANYGKTFCAPPTTTFKELAAVVSRFSAVHPELNGQVTDKQTIQALADSYPCHGKNIEVAPTGEYATIDTKSTVAIMQKLHNTVAHENDDLVSQIEHNSGNYMPPSLFALAALLYRQGDIDNAIFWFNAARLRGSFDAVLTTDISARSAIQALVQQIPEELIKKQFDDIPKLNNIIDRVLKWDKATAYNYDHRWISLHGMNAINSGLENAVPAGSLTVPRDTWDALAKQNRDQYRKSFDDAVIMLQKQRAAGN